MNIVQRFILAGAVAIVAITCVINPPLMVERTDIAAVYRTDSRAAASRAIGIGVAALLACLSVRGYPKREKGPLEGLL